MSNVDFADLISQADAADMAGVSVKTIRRYVSEGLIAGYRIGPRVIRVDVNEIRNLLSPIAASSPAA